MKYTLLIIALFVLALAGCNEGKPTADQCYAGGI